MRKVAFVSGSSRGIGLGVLRRYAQGGYAVIMSGRSPEKQAEQSLKTLESCNVPVSYVQCDIARAEDRQKAVESALERYGRIDVVVNNAGLAPAVRASVLETTEESFDRVVGANLKGTFFMCQLFAQTMIGLKKSLEPDYIPRIINISSISAYTSSSSRGEYCISKAGIAMVTMLFADLLSEYGIPVFEIRPGIIKTDMTAPVTAKYDKFIMEDNGLPCRRWGLPEDVAEAAYALAGGAFDYCPGQVINVDGGFHIRRL